MKRRTLIAAAVIAITIVANGFAGGSNESQGSSGTTTAPAATPATPAATPASSPSVSYPPMVEAIDNANGVFSDFFGTTAVDSAVTSAVMGDGLLTIDRLGNIVYNAIEGETIRYNNVDYTYTGLANVKVTPNDPNNDGTVDTTTYRFQLRQGVKFSDGVEMTADDLLFTFYVFLDPSYTGSSTINSLGILGYEDFLTGVNADIRAKYTAIANAAWDNTAGATAAQKTEFASSVEYAFKRATAAITAYVLANYGTQAYIDAYFPAPGIDLTKEGWQVAFGMGMWGFASLDANNQLVGGSGKTWTLKGTDLPTNDDYYNEAVAKYGTLQAFIAAGEVASGDPKQDAINNYVTVYGQKDPAAGQVINSVSGIRRIDNYTVEVEIAGLNAAAIYRMAVSPNPLHYYGDKNQYNFAQSKFGFPKGDLSMISAKNGSPMGAGAYKFVKYENKRVYLEANPLYWRGAANITDLQQVETLEADKVTALTTGTADTSGPSNSKAKLQEIAQYNSNGQPTGDTITYFAVDYLGYGYIGMNPNRIKVGTDKASDASKSLRKAIATILAVYRDLTVDSYYGQAASVINYPISATSWASPQRTDPGYTVAYSKNVNGGEIYTSGMSSAQRYAAAEAAALEYLRAAGYTISGGKATAAPEGGAMSYTVLIGGGGTGDHPTFTLLTNARDSLAKIGLTLNIQDLADSSQLFNQMNGGTADIWVAAWQQTVDPDIYQTYYSENAIGVGGTDSNIYCIEDKELDQYIVAARSSLDNNYRKTVLQEAFNIIMDWAVEVPVYQRQNAVIYSTKRVDISSLGTNWTTYFSYYSNEPKMLPLNK
jgi:peptide/nickel transport system substrate-binding protein